MFVSSWAASSTAFLHHHRTKSLLCDARSVLSSSNIWFLLHFEKILTLFSASRKSKLSSILWKSGPVKNSTEVCIFYLYFLIIITLCNKIKQSFLFWWLEHRRSWCSSLIGGTLQWLRSLFLKPDNIKYRKLESTSNYLTLGSCKIFFCYTVYFVISLKICTVKSLWRTVHFMNVRIIWKSIEVDFIYFSSFSLQMSLLTSGTYVTMKNFYKTLYVTFNKTDCGLFAVYAVHT